LNAETYTPGHAEEVSQFMARRTLASHGAFFVPHLRPGVSLLDCGCGPGSITVGIAALVDPGEVVGIDFAPGEVARATQAAARDGCRNIRIQAANVYSLPFENGRFERVFSHALIEHLADPQTALRELHRVLAPEGQAGRNLGVYLEAAGFEWVQLSARYECYDARELIAEYLARRLEEAGDAESASVLRDWSKQKPGMFAQAWVCAVARKPQAANLGHR